MAAYAGRPLDWRASLQAGVRHLGPLLWVAIIVLVTGAVTSALFFAPAVWLGVMWSVAVPAVMVERLGGPRALGRSFALVRGRWWATFAELLFALVILFVALFGLGLVLGVVDRAAGVASVTVWAVLSGAVSVISYLVAAPLVAAVLSVVYVDLRVRKEGLDAERLAAAIGGGPRW